MLHRNNTKFENYKEKLKPGNKLLLYTDGLVEARPEDGDLFFESANLEETLIQNIKEPCDVFLENVMSELIKFRKSDQFDDDIYLICLDV